MKRKIRKLKESKISWGPAGTESIKAVGTGGKSAKHRKKGY